MTRTIGSGRVTLEDVAQAAKVSAMTVSRVLNNKDGVSERTRARVLETVRNLGYATNASPNSYTNHDALHFLAVVVADMGSDYMCEVLQGVSAAAERLSYGLMLFTQGHTDHLERSAYYASLLCTGLVEGILMIASADYDILTTKFQQNRIPYVLVDDHLSERDSEPRVQAANYRGTLDAMRHLLALGHRRIGFITGRLEAECSVERMKGYKDALHEVGLPFDPELIREGDFHRSTGNLQARDLLDLPKRPTAIVASNDEMAFGVMDAAAELGLCVGQDISVVGFDDVPMASTTTPGLTTVRQPLRAMGEAALEMLVSLVEGKRLSALHRELPTELIIRGSTTRAPHF